MFIKRWILIAAAGLVCMMASCTSKTERTRPLVLTTTGMLGDLAEKLAGDSLDVVSLMGPGVDPHLYKATQRDLSLFEEADLIVYNGLHLEGKLSEILNRMKNQTYAAAEFIPDDSLKRPPEYEGAWDPHVWHDVLLWKMVAEGLATKLTDAFPQYETLIGKNLERELVRLDSLHTWVEKKISVLPQQHKVLITAHDAFGYFALRYGMKVKALQGLSTVSEFGLQDITRLVEEISRTRVPAAFIESSVSPRSVQALIEGCKSRGHDLKLGGTLYSDAMGDKGTAEGEYHGMIRHNVEAIVEALQ